MNFKASFKGILIPQVSMECQKDQSKFIEILNKYFAHAFIQTLQL